MALKNWEILEADEKVSVELERQCGVGKLLAWVLAARGYNTQTAQEILGEGTGLLDPFLLPDMEKAVCRIELALKKAENIVVYGDYDVDGMTATVILVKYLKQRGAKVSHYIPDREEEGYGLNCEALKRLKKAGAKLIITVDNGIVAVDEAKFAKAEGLDLIITDHHTLREELPDAVAVIDPLREGYEGFGKIAGVCVAFKLIAALEGGSYEEVLKTYGAFVCVGTVADVMPIVQENRYIAKKGLKLLKQAPPPGLEALGQVAGLAGHELSTKDVGFAIAPRLNAAARLNSVEVAVDLLMSEDLQQGEEFAKELEKKNTERRRLEKLATEAALEILEQNPQELNNRVVVVDGEGWHPGVLGIVAAKLCARFGKPCVVIGKGNGVAKGSGRSVEGFPLIDALNSMKECFVKHGGHKVAVGFSIEPEKIEEFKSKIRAYARENFAIMPVSKLKIDKEVELAELTVGSVGELERLQPFGNGNEPPLFLIKNAQIKQVIPLCGGKYVKVRVQKNGATQDLLCFERGVQEFLFFAGESVDAVVACNVGFYGVIRQLNIKIVEMRPAGFDQGRYFALKQSYEDFKAGTKELSLSCPTRQEVALVYRYIKKHGGQLDEDLLFLKLTKANFEYCKLKVIVEVLQELNLIFKNKYISVNSEAQKCVLEDSKLLQGIRQQN